jgi:hypothetical protein
VPEAAHVIAHRRSRADSCKPFLPLAAGINRRHYGTLVLGVKRLVMVLQYHNGLQWFLPVQRSVRPPSTVKSAPVTYEAASDARNATTAATSAGVPTRFRATSLARAARLSGAEA